MLEVKDFVFVRIMDAANFVNKIKSWDVVSRDLLLACPPWFTLWKETLCLPDGRQVADYYQLDQRDYVEVVAWKDENVLGLWRYKHGPRKINLGLPAGYLEPGETPLNASKRELREEVGLLSDHWRHLGSYYLDGNRSSARAHIFSAHNCQRTTSEFSDDLETHVEEWYSPKDWIEFLIGGKVVTLGAVLAVYAGILLPSLLTAKEAINGNKGETHGQ